MDEASGDIYVAEAQRHVVSQYNSAGTWEGWITNTPAGALGEPAGLALAPAGDLYVADAGVAVVDRFGVGVVVPDVETGKVAKSSLTRTSAVLAGTINGDGKASKYRFQYGETQALGSETASQGSGSGEEKVSLEVSGLHAGRTYYFRLIGENENGANYGLIHEFQTPPAVEALSTGPIKALQPESVTLTGKLTPGGFDAHYYFQWGTTVSYGNSTRPLRAPTQARARERSKPKRPSRACPPTRSTTTGSSPKTASARPLDPIRASRPQVRRGSQANRPRPSARAKPRSTRRSTPISSPAPTISSTARAPLTAAKRHSEAKRSAKARRPVAVSAALSGLQVGTTYHFRVIAENSAGSSTGPDQTLHDRPAGARRCDLHDRRERHRSDAAHADQPARQRHPLLLPVRHRELPGKPRRLHEQPAAAGRRHRLRRRRRRPRTQAHRPDSRTRPTTSACSTQTRSAARKGPSGRSRPKPKRAPSRWRTTALWRWSPRRTRAGRRSKD